jgi:hypothetical protein
MRTAFIFVAILLVAFLFWGCEKAEKVTAPEQNYQENDHSPEIAGFTITPPNPQPYTYVEIRVIITDEDYSGSHYCFWQCDYGTIYSENSDYVRWGSNYPGQFYIKCTVMNDPFTVTDSVLVTVGAAPVTPNNPSPVNDAVDVPINITLSWSCSDLEGDSIYYNVFLAEENAWGYGGSDNPVAYSLTANSFTPNTLSPNTIYRWGVEARDNFWHTSYMSNWTFTTAQQNRLNRP